jgi:signal transduction histidine kinase
VYKRQELATALSDAEAQRNIAQEASRVKSEILNVVAHDLQTPISSILNFTYLLKQSSELSSKQSEMLSRIENVSQAMLRQTVNLLNAASETVNSELRREPVELLEMLQSIVEHCGAARKQQSIEVSIAPDAVVIGDSEKLRELFENLVDNAVKYSPRRAIIGVSGYPVDGFYQIAVKDAGQGLSEDDKQKLFGKFQRLSAKPTAGESSTGLGLYIAKQIAERHNGKIWAESEGIGKGATFFVRLPL